MPALRVKLPLALAALAGILGCAQTDPLSSSSGQAPLPPPGAIIRQAGNILPPHILRGSNYAIEEQVILDGYSYVFRIRTTHGVLGAKTLDMLGLRLSEMYSIELATQLSRQAHILQGVQAGIENARAGLAALLADPAGTIGQAPEGLRRKADELFDAADRRAGGEVRRRLATRIGCDPESRNPILKSMLDEMSIRQQIGSFLTGQAMDLVVPGISLLPTTYEMRQLVRSQPPHILNQRIEAELKATGFSPQLSESFCRGGAYTTLQRLLLLQHLRTLRGTANLDVVLAAATAARSEADALEIIHAASFLAQARSARGLTAVFRAGLLGGKFQDDTQFLVLIADEIASPEPLDGYLAAYRQVYPDTPSILVTTARLQPVITDTLRSHNITLP